MLASVASGLSHITNLAPGADVASTMSCMAALGARISTDQSGTVTIQGRGPLALRASPTPLDCGNSGTTARLLAGLLTNVPGRHTLIGDESLSRRPMGRVCDPLRRIGAQVRGSGAKEQLPVTVLGGGYPVRGGRIQTAFASAQVKSALLLAGLFGAGPISVDEPAPTRDHTERMLASMGVPIELRSTSCDGAMSNRVTIHPCLPRAIRCWIPGDLSIAAFLIALGVGPSSQGVNLIGVGLNPGRIGLLNVLSRMGARIETSLTGHSGFEPYGDIRCSPSPLVATHIGPREVPELIDEIPIIAALATQARGVTRVTGASELRVKESDRIKTIVSGLAALGADVRELPDGLEVTGPTPLLAGTDDHPLALETLHDHRIAMSLAVAAHWAVGVAEVRHSECASISDPEFWGRIASGGVSCAAVDGE